MEQESFLERDAGTATTDTDRGAERDHAAGASTDPPGTNQRLAIDTDDLRLTYADGTEALQGVSLSVPEGEFFGVLGPNGAGKTTMITILATLLAPTDGAVRVNGYDALDEQTAVRASIGYMAQSVSVDEELTARENLAFACDAYGVPRGDRAERIDDLLDLVDLADVADDPAGTFSGGMKKRLDAATALVHEPDLVFLDEPTTGLDPKARNRLWDYFEDINDRGTTIVLTTQYLEEADALCERLAVLRDGRVVERGSPDALKRRVGGEILEIGVDGDEGAARSAADALDGSDALGNDASIDVTEDGVRVVASNAREVGADLILALRDAGITVTGFDVDEPTLDDVFLAIADEDHDALDVATEPREGSA